LLSRSIKEKLIRMFITMFWAKGNTNTCQRNTVEA